MSTAEIRSVATAQLVTADNLFRDYAGERCELIEGKVIHVSPTGYGHGSIESRIARLLGNFVEEHKLGDVTTGEVGFVVETNPDTVLAPDVAFVRQQRLEEIGIPETFFPEAPALAIEVVSPSDATERVNDKALRWLTAGAELVWIVYPKRQTATVYRAADNVKLLSTEDALDGADVLPGFSVKVAELFAGLKP